MTSIILTLILMTSVTLTLNFSELTKYGIDLIKYRRFICILRFNIANAINYKREKQNSSAFNILVFY